MISRSAAISALFAFAGVVFAQTLPPPAFAGQTYWYGPGPSAYTVSSGGQDSGGYSEMYMSGGNWIAGVNGGPAFSSVSAGGASITSTFTVDTTVTVEPYIYVDGYFGITASVSGFGGTAIDIGTSRFYILHNCPIVFLARDYTNLGLGSPTGTPSLSTIYRFEFSNYANPALLDFTIDAIGGSAGMQFNGSTGPSDTGGVLQVDVTRHTTFPNGTQAGTYVGTGVFTVSSV